MLRTAIAAAFGGAHALVRRGLASSGRSLEAIAGIALLHRFSESGFLAAYRGFFKV